MVIGNNPVIMDRRRNSRLMNVMGWAMTAVMAVAAVAAIELFLTGRG